MNRRNKRASTVINKKTNDSLPMIFVDHATVHIRDDAKLACIRFYSGVPRDKKAHFVESCRLTMTLRQFKSLSEVFSRLAASK